MSRRPVDDRDDRAGLEGLRSLADVSPPASLVAKVMRDVEQPHALSLWGWLGKRRRLKVSVTLSPIGILCGAGMIALAVGFMGANTDRPPLEAAFVLPDPHITPHSSVQVRFVMTAAGARQVFVVGDFNGWDPAATPLEPVGMQDTFAVTLPLSRGQHEYMFVVDGRWMADPSALDHNPDGFGQNNSVLRVQ